MITAYAPVVVDLAHEPRFELGALEVRPSTREVVAGDLRQGLEPRIMQVLVALARRRGEVVSRQDLITACWGGRLVGEEAINRCIAAIRRLAETHGGFSITTVARVGYRLDEAVAALDQAATAKTPLLARRAPLVGRDKELAALQRLLAEALAGNGTMALLSGEPGIGKTRLAEEIGAEAARRGALVLTAHCYEAAGAVPYIPFVEMLERIGRVLTPDAFRRTLGEDAAQAARIYPELRRRFSDIPPPVELPPEQERRYLFNGLRDYLERLAAAQPVVLVFEDLHWADEATLALLRHIALRLSEIRVLIVGTHRDADRDVGVALAEFLEEGSRRHYAEPLALRGLSLDEATALVQASVGREFPRARVVGPDVPPIWVVSLHKTTEGNPLFIEEVLRHLAKDGRLFDVDGRLRRDIAIGELGVLDGVRLMIRRRLAQLSDNARRVLAAGAVVGPRFDVELLEALELGEPEGVLDGLDEAEAAGLVTGQADGYRFDHDLIRQAIIAGLSPPRRQHMHARVAAAMERVYAGEIEARSAEIGYHLSEAGSSADPATTVRYLLLAGNSALKSAAFDEATVHFEAGLSVAPPNASRERAQLLFGRGQSQRSVERWDDAIDDCRQSLEIHEQLGEVEAVAKVCIELADRLTGAGRSAEAIEICDRGLGALGDRRSADRARLLGLSGFNLCLLRQYEAGGSLLDQAEEIANDVGDLGVAAVLCGMRATIHNEQGDQRKAASGALQAARKLQATGDLWRAAGSLTEAAGALWWLARWDEAELVLDEAEPLADRVGNSTAWIWCQLIRSGITGYRNGVLFDERDKDYLRELVNVPGWRPNALYQIGAAEYRQGRWEEACGHFEEGMQTKPGRAFDRGCWSGLLVTLAQMGDRERAEAMIAGWPIDLTPAAIASPRFQAEWDRRYATAEALVVLGHLNEAARFYPALSGYLAHRVVGGFSGRLLQSIVGMTAAAGGRWVEAERDFQSALELADHLPHRTEQAYTRQAWAEALLRRGGTGDRARALQFLAGAAERYEKIGMPRHLEIARAMIAAA